MEVYNIDEINKNCKIRMAKLEKMLAEHKLYLAEKYPSK